ncbi:MAG: [protein-PII] uridylyltransferase [Pseudomonadota bacterium]
MLAGAASTLPSLRQRLKQGRDALAAEFFSHPRSRHYLRHHARLVDEVLCGLCDTLLPKDACLVAVGGYGRGELFPASDVDVLLLIPHEPDAQLRASIEAWVQSCWDAGLEIGHSIRTPRECASEADQDITIETALLESRMLWGSKILYHSFGHLFHARFDGRRFAESKLVEQKNRHNRFQDSAYNLEPNLKDSPGGLRDLHMIHWLAQAAGAGSSWSELAKSGLLSRQEAQRLARIQQTLNLLRIHLHFIARRREDRLAFDYQSQLADRLGINATAARRAGELLMQRYYRAAKQVRLANEMLLPALHAQLKQEPVIAVPLDAEFELHGNLLSMRRTDLFASDPTAMLRAFLTAMRHSVTAFEPATLRALWRARTAVDRQFRNNPANRAAFLEILRAPAGVTWALAAMSRYGILGRYLPAFGRIAGQMQHDGFHIYTVDEHTLAVLRNVRRFAIAEFSHEYPLASRLMQAFDKPELLYLAALFHDIAKGRGGDHSELGAKDAHRFCKAHGLPQADVELVAWLVREHLSMSRTAQKEDLGDAAVIDGFARKMGDARHLDALYVLTVADIRGTSPKVWNTWKGKLLENLYFAAQARLSGKAAASEGLSDKRAEAQAKLALYGIAPNAANELWNQLDDSYFLRFDAQDIAWHARMLWQNPHPRHAIVRARLSPAGDGIQVMVYSPDMPDLFARICGFFARNQFSVAEAKIHTTRHGLALDSFHVLDDGRREVHYRDFLQFIEHELGLALDPSRPPEPVPAGRLSRRLKHFPIPPEIEIRADERGRYHVLSLICGDRTGLLYRIAEVFQKHNVSLYSAKIHTLGERAEDRFLMRGAVLENQKSLLELERELLGVLEQA